MGRLIRTALLPACIALCGALLTSPAQAAFPGQNGRIAFSDTRDDPNPSGCGSSCNYEIYSINPDGTGLMRLTNNPASDGRPAWSPDGSRIVFVSSRAPFGIYIMNADGSGQTFLRSGFDPSWSPDGTKILYVPDGGECGAGTGGVWKMNPDGSNPQFVACGPSGPGQDGEGQPAWSPDGRYITFVADLANFDIFRVNADGSNRVDLSVLNDFDSAPDWAPNSSRIAWQRDQATSTGSDIWAMNPDGSNKTALVAEPGADEDPAYSPDGTKIVYSGFQGPFGLYISPSTGGSGTFLTRGIEANWQPMPVNGYARPKGATPTRLALVTANLACAAPNRTHGAPLAFPSCAPPQLASAQLTVGTGDSNARPALMQASMRFDAVAGDVNVNASLNDVFNKDLTDYTGGLRASVPVQITDKNNTPSPGGPGAGTTQTFPFEFDIACTTTADPNAGSDCNRSTSLNALFPGSVVSGKRAIWELGQAKVYDGGADGNPATAGDNTLFATQGVFIP